MAHKRIYSVEDQQDILLGNCHVHLVRIPYRLGNLLSFHHRSSVKMVLYVYLIVYPERTNVPAHWSILVTNSENGKRGPVYHAIGAPFMGYQVEVKPDYDLAKTRKRHTVVFIGCVDDNWSAQLATMAHLVAAPGPSSTPLDPFSVSAGTDLTEEVQRRLTLQLRVEIAKAGLQISLSI